MHDYSVIAVQGGQLRTHPRSQCHGRDIPCCVHAPSDHHMRDWPLNWRADAGVMERLCPCGVGHPDPDHLAYARSLTPVHDCALSRDHSPGERPDLDDQGDCAFPHLEWQSVHGCCGCCHEENDD